jgi:hypothetical protein
VILSKRALAAGLGMSMMERLIALNPYAAQVEQQERGESTQVSKSAAV